MNKDRRTLDLFAWEPPQVTRVFEKVKVQAANLRSAVSRAVALALKECGKAREQIAQEISEYLGEDCTKAMLDAYASEARAEHSISLIRFIGLVAVTRDIRLLNLIAEPFGWTVVPTKYVAAVEEAMLTDRIEDLQARRAAARSSWKRG